MSVCDAHFTIAKSNKRSYTLYVYTVNYGGLGIHKTLMNLSAYTHTHTNAHTYVCTYTHTHTHIGNIFIHYANVYQTYIHIHYKPVLMFT